MAAPTRSGSIGDTYFDGQVTWVCLGGTRWETDIGAESEPGFTQAAMDDTTDMV
jgi:hypothetical protein